MAINWQDVITALGGDAVLLGIAAWLVKQLVSNRLTMEAEKFKIEVKAQADTEIERVKALLTRGYRIHERQLDTLQKLYRHFSDAQAWLQRMTSGGRFGNEISPQEYSVKVDEAVRAVLEEFLSGRLFLPSPLAQECDTFFHTAFEGQQNFALANMPTINPMQRAEFWQKAGEVAYQQVPKVLKRIEEAARAVIFG
jgi:hypothetical protein